MLGKLKQFLWLGLLCGLLAVCVRSARPTDSDLFAFMDMPLPRDVSREFVAANGVQVLQLTDDPYGSELSDYDIPFYQPETRRLFWNTLLDPETNEWALFSAQWPEWKPRLIIRRIAPSADSTHMDMSYDRRIVTYPRVNDGGDSWDLYGIPLSEDNLQELRITEKNYPLKAGDSIVTSPASWDAKLERYLMAFGINSDLFLVYADGGNQFSQVGPWQPAITDLSQDPRRRERDTRLARVRLNPAYASLLLFRRHGVTDLWLQDVRAGAMPSVRLTDEKPANAQWTPDGGRVGAKEHGMWIERNVATLLGNVVDKLNVKSVKRKVIGSFGGLRPEGAALYASYSADGKYVAIVTDHRQNGGGKLYIVELRTGKTQLLCDLRYGMQSRGQPRMGFVEGQSALVFSSDQSSGRDEINPPQLFMVRW